MSRFYLNTFFSAYGWDSLCSENDAHLSITRVTVNGSWHSSQRSSLSAIISAWVYLVYPILSLINATCHWGGRWSSYGQDYLYSRNSFLQVSLHCSFHLLRKLMLGFKSVCGRRKRVSQGFAAASLALRSARSFPRIPTCAGTKHRVVCLRSDMSASWS